MRLVLQMLSHPVSNPNMLLSSTVYFNSIIHIKGYLCYKTKTESVLSKGQVKNFFLFRRKVIFRSQDIQVFVVLAILRFSKFVMS